MTAKFDMGHSGAMLTWEHFFPDQEPPPLLLHRDRDLWRFALRTLGRFRQTSFRFPTTSKCGTRSWRPRRQHWRPKGEAIERKHFKDIRELLGVTTRDMVIGGHRVPVANLPYDEQRRRTRTGEGRPFAACYWDAGRPVFSLRSSDDGADVASGEAGTGAAGTATRQGVSRGLCPGTQAFEV